jgi:hypothetical protein
MLLHEKYPNWKITVYRDVNKQSFALEINEKKYLLQRNGFWNQTLQWIDDLDFVVVELQLENAFVGKYSLLFSDEQYQLEFANLPLVTIQLYQSDHLEASYGLAFENQRIQLVTHSSGNIAPILEATMFVLMYPYAAENIGIQSIANLGN